MLKNNLTKLMEQKGITISDLSERTGISIPTLKKLRTVSNSNPTLDSLLKLSKFFDISIDDLTSHEVGYKDTYSVPMIIYDQLKFFLRDKHPITAKPIQIENSEPGIDFCVILTRTFFNFNEGCILFCCTTKDFKNGDYFIGVDAKLYKLIKNDNIFVALGSDQNTAIISQDFLYAKVVKVKFEVNYE